MQGNKAPPAARGSNARIRFLQGSSTAALALILSTTPAFAQLARMRAALGIAPTVVTPQTAVSARPVVQREALARSIEHQALANNMRGAILEAQKAAIASLRSLTLPAVGDGVTNADGSNAAAGLDPVRDGVFAALDPTGVNTWQGADLPTQVDNNGKPLVTIVQTDQRAILSWNRFDVGANTTLNFDQKLNGVAQPGWIALNRVSNAVAPSRILGTITADGTVAVINQRGVIFEKGVQVNLHSLLVSSLEIGNFAVRKVVDGANVVAPTTIADRNANFLQSGFSTPDFSIDRSASGQIFAPQLTSAILPFSPQRVDLAFDPSSFLSAQPEGNITVDSGAKISATGGGFIIFTAPGVTNNGVLTSPDGQVSLQAGRGVSAAISTGAATVTDVSSGSGPDVRGLVLRSWLGLAGTVANTGLIDVPRGYISLGSGELGTISNAGLLSATTSVSRNAKISLTGGTIVLGRQPGAVFDGGIVVTPDTNGETVPIGTAAAPPAFKTTKIEIGNIYLSRGRLDESAAPLLSIFGPAGVQFGSGSLLLAPNADLVVGGTYVDPRSDSPIYLPPSLGSIDVAAGSIIDVSGVKDFQIDASRNSLKIDPLKRNELRDTPNYREVTTNGDFTLNGATVYVDPRVSGVRADGVTWVGSPLIEAGSAASQIPVSAAELMTRGGNISMTVALVDSQSAGVIGSLVSPLAPPRINIASGATIDFSGGWVHYGDGLVRSSKLLTSDGRVVDIAKADPNDDFVAVGDGFTEIQSKYGISRTFANFLLQGGRLETGYDEGRDAGTLALTASTLDIAAPVFGNAFTGNRQAANALRPTRGSLLSGDGRRLQASPAELPSGGNLSIASTYETSFGFRLGADIVVYHGDRSAIARPHFEILLSDTALSGSGLSGLSLTSSGKVSFAADSAVALENGAVVSVVGKRSIDFGGSISAPSGTITAETRQAPLGSVFRTDDDLGTAFLKLSDIPNPYDITVSGRFSVAGLWTNDLGKTGSDAIGAGYVDGGSVRLETAATTYVAFGPVSTVNYAADLSGSINVADTALIDVSSGGYIAPNGKFNLNAKGGNIGFINLTNYAAGDPSLRKVNSGPTVAYTPVTRFDPITGLILTSEPQLVPVNPDAHVSFLATSLKGFGFGGGGTFTLVAPDVAMGSDVGANGAGVGLDFLQKTGFATLDLSVNRSRIIPDLFRGVKGNSAFSETALYRVASGQTLDLTQWVRSPFVDAATAGQLTRVATGGDISFLTPIIPLDPFDRSAATLRLGGLSELDVAVGGTITGAPGATLAVSKLLNEGTIRIAGGSILQQFSAAQAKFANGSAFDVRDVSLGGGGLGEILGGGNGRAPFAEADLTSAILYSDPGNTRRLANAEVFFSAYYARNVYFLGQLDANEGIRLGTGSITDLSGTTLFDPRPPLLPSGQGQLTGRLYGGGTIRSGQVIRTLQPSGSPLPITNFAQKLMALPGAVIDLRGTSAIFDEAVGPATYRKAPQWSNGGRLSLTSGGSLGGSMIRADGGAAQAEGGILEWLNPVMRQTDLGVRANDILFANAIQNAGFDSVTAYNGFVVDGIGGNVGLTLGKSFTVKSFAGPTATVAGGGSFTVNAPFVSLQQTRTEIINDDRASAPFIDTLPGTAVFNASRNIDLVGRLTFVLPGAVSAPNVSPNSVNFISGGDVRLVGLATGNPASVDARNSLTGGIAANADINFQAAQVYATTGTGNLQQELEARNGGRAFTPTPYDIASSDPNGTVRFAMNPGATGSNIYSAGTHIRVRAANIVQAGNLLAPLGLLELGSNSADGAAPATKSLVFAAGSTTSVSGSGRLIPYGTTTDLTDYLFSPNTPQSLSAPPVGQLELSGDTIDIAAGATIDGRGGGDVFAYEFVSGTGGSRDVLDRFNSDLFSGNSGLQFADGRQVYAILPRDRADLIAKFDPVYSADYSGSDGLYSGGMGRSVILDASPGVAAGEYVLLPAHYALLPNLGALRIVENVGEAVPLGATSLLDGSVLTGGTYATAGTGLAESTRRSFTLQKPEVFKQSSRLETTFATAALVKLADKAGSTVPRLPLDAARVILSPLNSLKVAGLLNTSAPDGRGAQFDIGGRSIKITGAAGTQGDPVITRPGQLALTTATLTALNASSLLIGGERTDNKDGTTTLDVLASDIEVDGRVSFTTPELILAVAGQGSTLQVDDGAALTAAGSSGDSRTGDYRITSSAIPIEDSPFDASGIGSVLRLASGDERLIQRQGDFALRNTLKPSRLAIGAATITGTSLALDTSRTFAIGNKAVLANTNIAISGDILQFGSKFIEADVEATLARAARLTLRSPDVIRFGASTPHIFNDLSLDAPGLALVAPTGAAARSPSTLAITADRLTLANSAKDLGDCTASGVRACGRVGNSAILSATELSFGSGQFSTYGFDKSVTFNASNGTFVEGVGGLTVTSNTASLTIGTPFLVDRSSQADLSRTFVRPDYTFLTDGAFTLTAPAGPVVAPAGSEAPGTRIAIGSADAPVASAAIDGVSVRATSGLIDVRSAGSITVSGKAVLATPGYARTFGDATDAVTVSANAGTVNLYSKTGGIDAGSDAVFVVDNGLGDAGTLKLTATRGVINFAAALNPGIAVGLIRTASLDIDGLKLTSGSSAFDFDAFIDRNGTGFGGDIAIRTGTGNLTMGAGRVLKARSLSLTADDGATGQGLITIAGTIDTSGDDVTALDPTDPRYSAARVSGGAIGLYGNGGVTLAATARLKATTAGYNVLDSRVASAGDVTLAVGRVSTAADPVAVNLVAGSDIDVRALRSGTRLVSQLSKDPDTLAELTTFRYAEADKGGLVTLRAPLSPTGQIDIRFGGAIEGARSVDVEAFKRFDLQAIGALGNFTGVSADGVHLDASATGAKPNFLSDTASGTLPDFVRNFRATTVDGQSLAAFNVRPGIELDSNGGIILDSILNLGAGKIFDYAGAEAAGLIERSPLGPDAAGNQRYQLVANGDGHAFENETRLFNQFVDMTYRVGGSVSGAAPVLTLRATTDLEIKNSITDGFFAFHDRTDADYISYQLGGGDRTYHPALALACGASTGACANGASYTDVVSGSYIDPDTGRSVPSLRSQIRVAIGKALQGGDGAPFVHSPYGATANMVAASGTGDPLGIAELFPLVNGKAANSSTIRLVGGSGGFSVNPLHVDAATARSVLVSGERSYTIDKKLGSLGLAGLLQLRVPQVGAKPEYFDIGSFFDDNFGSDAEQAKDYYTVLTWGNGTQLATDARASASAFFTGATFNGPVGARTGVIARLEDIVAFLAGPNFAGATYADNVTQGVPGYASVTLARVPITGRSIEGKVVYTSTTVRTGNGSIAVAASGDVNLLKTTRPLYRSELGTTSPIAGAKNALVGSNAIYTAGVRADTSLPAGVALPVAADEPIDYFPGRNRNGGTAGEFIASGVKPIAPAFADNGGAVSISAGGSVVGRRDVWGELFGPSWRAGKVGLTTTLTSNPEYFTSGVATLAGGNLDIRAGRSVTDLSVALANNVFTGSISGAPTLFALGSGDLVLRAGSDLLGGRIGLASGTGVVTVGGNVGSAGTLYKVDSPIGVSYDNRNLLNLRLNDAALAITATGSVDIGGVSAFGAGYRLLANDFGFYSPLAALSVASNETVSFASNERVQRHTDSPDGPETGRDVILPGSVRIASLTGDIALGSSYRDGLNRIGFNDDYLLYPSAYGQLNLFAGRNIQGFALAMLDADPADLPGALSIYEANPTTLAATRGLAWTFPVSGVSDKLARQNHNRHATHLGDLSPARIAAQGSIIDAYVSLPKQARISAGGDIVDFAYRGQNLAAGDVTRITAGGDITTTKSVISDPGRPLLVGRAFNVGNDIEVGGPGALFVEAGRDLGPFLVSGNGKSGGIRTVGNDANPWLPAAGANIYAMFGLKSPATGAPSGADYAGLRKTYLDPANLAQLDGDLFEQTIDANGNKTPDRGRYVYAPILAQWLFDNENALFKTIFDADIASAASQSGGTTLTEARRLAADTTLDAAAKTAATAKLDAAAKLADAAYPKFAQLISAFDTLGTATPADPGRGALRQREFLLDRLYFGELAAPADPTGNSYLQYLRAYRAVQTLFPSTAGYTDNLATYDGTTKKLDGSGQPLVATRVRTGNADLRLSAIQTTRGGDITLMGPGGDVIAGSVVRLSQQLARTAQGAVPNPFLSGLGDEITSYPIGNEGVLTLRGGGIRSFTDGDFRLNQSRLFAVNGGDLVLFSSNGDLNAGQGPKSSSSFPPVTLRCDPDFFCEVDSAGSVAGAGIATFRPSPLIPASSVTLIAPVGTVDAGDAGVRASGNVFVAAARVANADNFKVGGAAFGVPTLGTTTAAVPAGATNAINANTFRPNTLAEKITDRLSQILVNVLGYVGGTNDQCPENMVQDANGQCQPKQ